MIHYLGNISHKVRQGVKEERNKKKLWNYGYDKDFDIIVISKDGTIGDIYEVNGIHIAIPSVPKDETLIINHDAKPTQQKWKREPLPKGLNEETQFNSEYRAYIEEEFRRREEGVFIYINGKLVYLTGTMYFFLQWNRLDEGYADFRVIQNELMIYWEACKADQRCYGIIYVKNRRFGWSSICNAEQIDSGTLAENKELGIISKTREDGRKMFGRLVRAFKKLPPFFMPSVDGNTTPKQELILSEPSRKRKQGEKRELEEGLDTTIRFHSTVLNAMDGDKIYRSSIDECFGKGTKILMADMTFKSIEDVNVGDYVIVEGSKKLRVAKRMYGIDDMYKISQPYSEDYVVSSKHRLYLEQRCKVKSIKDDGIKVMTPEEYLSLGKYRKRTTYGVRSKGIELEYKEVSLDPYLLGLWLGDGFNDNSLILVNTKEDIEISNFIKQYAKDNDYSLSINKTKSDVCKKYTLKRPLRQSHLNGNSVKNKFMDSLREYSLFKNKHIPTDYLNNSREVRLKMLAGLIDSDGYLSYENNSYTYEIGMAKKDLLDDIIMLSRSLGYRANSKHHKTNFDTDSWRLFISGDKLHEIPCLVDRKKVPKTYKRQYASHINKIDVTPIGKGEYYGIQLEADNDDDRRLILGDFTISMNCGKYPKDCPFDQYWGIVKTSHRQGVRIVGKAMVGSTVNAMSKGGREFKTIYDSSNPTERNANDQTKSGLYQLFIPAQYCLEGYFDEYGFSIADTPSKPIKNDLGLMVEIGANQHIDNDLEGLKDDPEALNEYLRQNPRKERDAFRDEANDCEFNLIKIQEQIDHNEFDLPQGTIERGNFTWKDGIQDTEVIWRPNQNGRFWITHHPPEEIRNKREKKMLNGMFGWHPMAKDVGCFGVDPYNRSKTADGRGSFGSIHLSTVNNTTYLPNNAFILEYIDRPHKVELFFEDVIMAMVYYSMPMLCELSNEHFLKILKQRGYRHYSLNNPFKPFNKLNPTEKELGGAPQQNTKIGDQQFYAIETYIEDHVGVARTDTHRATGEMGFMPFTRTLEQWKDVDTANRTKYDAYISSSLSRLGNQRRKPMIKTQPKRTANVFTKYNNTGTISKIA